MNGCAYQPEEFKVVMRDNSNRLCSFLFFVSFVGSQELWPWLLFFIGTLYKSHVCKIALKQRSESVAESRFRISCKIKSRVRRDVQQIRVDDARPSID